MQRYVPFSGKKLIQRRELPSYERRGWEAREIAGRDCVFVSFEQTRTSVSLISGLPVASLSSPMYRGEPGPGIRDTVLVGFVKSESCVVLVDAVQIGGKRVTAKLWPDRAEMLRLLHLGFDEEMASLYPLSRIWTTGLVRAFDNVVSVGGAGLLLRHTAKPDDVLCLMEATHDSTSQ